MKQAPVRVFIFNPNGTYPWQKKTIGQQFQELVDIQSVGAAIENMLLTATGLGVGSLWICDVFIAYEELCQWMGKAYQMVAAVSFGYSDEAPNARGRKGFDEVVEW
jgi:nitroreductase